MLHLSFELPTKKPVVLNSDSSDFTEGEIKIVKEQIRKNSKIIDAHIRRIDLYVNKEKVPAGESFIDEMRKEMYLLMEENDTFRRVLQKHESSAENTVLTPKKKTSTSQK